MSPVPTPILELIGVRAAYGRCDVLVNSAGFTKPVPHANLDALTDAID